MPGDLQVPILETILHPPIGILQREILSGVYTGSGSIDKPAAVLPPFNNVNAYGLTWSWFTVPAGWGRTLGIIDQLEPSPLQLATVHEDRLGHALVSEIHSFNMEGLWWLWENAGPTRVDYWIAPGIEVTFYWLVVNLP